VDETYVKVGGRWKYLFRAVDKHGVLIDFMLSDRRNNSCSTSFPRKGTDNYAELGTIVDHHG